MLAQRGKHLVAASDIGAPVASVAVRSDVLGDAVDIARAVPETLRDCATAAGGASAALSVMEWRHAARQQSPRRT